MTWVWERMPQDGSTSGLPPVYELNQDWTSPLDGRRDSYYRVTAAWITRQDKRKWHLTFADTNEAQTFSTLKAAKAYALATIILGA